LGVNIAPTLPLFCPQNPILVQEVLKIHTNINNPISALDVRELPKFSRLLGNWVGGTQCWHEILDKKWKYGRCLHVQRKIYNISLFMAE